MTELMAIGDSLFNGVRSLTIDKTLAQWSAPAQVAKALGVADFAVPDYPRNVVINFETWIRGIVDIPGILDDISANIAFWNKEPRSAAAQFDNIAIASTTWDDMCNRTWKTAQAEIELINHQVAAGKTTYNDKLGDLFFAFNTRFILNPTSDPGAPAIAPLQIVAQRKPKRLLVSIGANNGLWQLAFAAFAGAPFNTVNGPYGPDQVAQLRAFITALEALPPEIEHIYLNTLPFPSTVPNMMPADDDDLSNKPGPAGFYSTYENRFGFNYGRLSAAQMKSNDQILIDLLAFTRTLVTDHRIHFVPIDQLLLAYDFKTTAAANQIPTPKQTLSNLMIDGGPDVSSGGAEFWDGGFAGLDGMHPTIVGYNLMAQAILDTITSSEPGFVPPAALPTIAQAFAADSLLNDLPRDWDPLLYAWRDIRQLFHVGAAPPAPTAQTTGMQALMKHVQFKTT
jgi:lysophospholipase L1-like esterase